MNPNYPIFILSKGRWESRLTSKALEEKGVPYRIVVEPDEFKMYASVIDKKKIIETPINFSELNQGSIPVRNFIWEMAISEGYKKHWLIDDNVINFYRLNLNRRIPVGDGTIFKCAEDFTDRYTNVAFSGMNNIAFAPDRNERIKPYTLNTRIYSITLINNKAPYRWRGKYNEDTDICLRALKNGWCTIQFNAFLADKATTLKMKGGNTDGVYNTGDERKEFAESLARQHPDVVKVVRKFNRWHHQVNYLPFKGNKLIKKTNVEIKNGVDNYGMQLIDINNGNGTL
tara:strand:- start:1296 stop:2153 length:858 start_codon:yes stop_codon:yes gene_type:complete